MTIEDITHLVRWSESIYPPVSISGKATTTQEQGALTPTMHAFMRAFVTTAFTLWTRCVDCRLSHQASHSGIILLTGTLSCVHCALVTLQVTSRSRLTTYPTSASASSTGRGGSERPTVRVRMMALLKVCMDKKIET